MNNPYPSNTPLVSVLIPVYNVQNYLPQCLDSVINQTYSNLEIIVVDDGSTDGCAQICDDFARKDTRIQVLHTENRGVAAARNAGLERSAGEYLLYFDSDDWLEKQTVEKLVKAAVEEKADIVVARICNEYVGTTVHSKMGTGDNQFFEGEDLLSAYAAGQFREVTWNKLFHRSCLANVRFPDGHNFEDVSVNPGIMTALAKRGGRAMILQEELFHFRMRKSSISHTRTYRNVGDSWSAYFKRFQQLPGHERQALPACFLAIGRMWANYSSFSKEEKRLAKDMLREMQAFSKAHFRETMRGKYPQRTKAVCLASQSVFPPVLWLCGCAGKVRNYFKNRKHQLFD